MDETIRGVGGSGDGVWSGPLSGLRIVELSSFVATPLCGLVLAQLGAEVIRVEQKGGAPDRRRLPRSPEGTSLYWAGLNKGKKSVAVDLTDRAGRDLVTELIVDGDGIVVTNGDRWPELSYAGLSARRPDVIHLLLNGLRDGGPAVDYTVQAATGYPLVQGPEEEGATGRVTDTRPTNSVVPTWDIAAGLYLATGLLAAERERARTGRGQSITISLEDVALATAGTLGYLAEAQLTGVDRGPSGNDVYGTYGRDFVSADGVRFMLVVITDGQWRKLVRVTGLADAMAGVATAMDADLGDEAERYRCRASISALLADVFASRPWSELKPMLDGARLLAEPYQSWDDIASDDAAQLRRSPLFSEVTQTGVATPFLAPGLPMVMDGRQVPAAVAPTVGEHTRAVLSDLLGLDADRIAALEEGGVL
jgi:2-methylfumaryl-CoA isomerase